MSKPVVILDTDVVGDAGDMAALAMLHGLASRDELEILAITCCATFPYAAGCVDATNRHYGRPDIPVGTYHGNGPTGGNRSSYAKEICERWPNRYPKGKANAPEAVDVLRRALAGQPDRSVTIVAVGPLTNLAALLQSAGDDASALDGVALVKQKVRRLSWMGGIFEEMDPWGHGIHTAESNVAADVESAQIVCEQWPTPIIIQGFEIGWGVMADTALVEAYPQSPVAFALSTQRPRPAWDQLAVLYAARDGEEYWTLSDPGRCVIGPDGSSEFVPESNGRHYIVTETKPKVELAELISEIQVHAEQTRPE